MNLAPMIFDPIFQPYIWGGRRLADWFPNAPKQGPVAEAWLVSDEVKFPSRVGKGPLEGLSLREIRAKFGSRFAGSAWSENERFPILLKLLDACDRLSVQVHPNDQQAAKVGLGLRGKTEAWVIVDAAPGACLYAGLRDGVGPPELKTALEANRVPELLHRLEPRIGDVIFLPAGTVHAIGAGLMIFEVQQTSDLTYRLYDWNRVDAKTGQPRPLHIPESLACIDFDRGPIAPLEPVRESDSCECLIACPYFRLWRHQAERPFAVGASSECRIIVCVDGNGQLNASDFRTALNAGSTWLLPADSAGATCVPTGRLTILECGLPCPDH